MPLPPLPPEPDWAPPPRSATDLWGAAADDDQARHAGMRDARLAGRVALGAVALSAVAGAGALGGWAQLAVLATGALMAGRLARSARRAGLPAGEVVTTALVAFALALAITVGVALAVGFGACLIVLGLAAAR